MGGKVSLHGDNDEGQKRNSYLDGMDDTDPLTEAGSRAGCSYWFSRAMKARIVYVTLLGCFVGLGIPLIMYFSDKPSGPGEIYGSCLLRQESRYKCLINKHSDPTEDECIDALCCWENNETLPFKCYHSFNPAYQYHVLTYEEQFEPESYEIMIEPNQKDRMSALTAKLIWIDSEHLNVQIYDPDKFPNGLEIETPPPGSVPQPPSANDGLNVTFSTNQGDYFYIRIGRNGTDETIFDTRIGPLISARNDFSFATVLPTQYFHGLKGGNGGGPIIYDVVKGYNNMDLPFYMPQERSGKVHGVLFDIDSPFIVQFTEAPGIMFHFEGSHIAMNMHFFIGPTAKDVSRQLSAHLSKNEPRSMPPYWALGLHLCRHLLDGELALNQIQDLERKQQTGLVEIPYDSDCIELNLRTPFHVDETKYNTTVLWSIISHLEMKNRRLLLTQGISLLEVDYANVSDHSYFINTLNNETLVGLNNGKNVYFPNLYRENWKEWLQTEFVEINMHVTNYSSGLVLTDNFPFSENSIKSCPSTTPRSRLGQKFLGEKEGLVCPEGKHFLTNEKEDRESKSHFEIHNEFGHEALLAFHQVFYNQTSSTTERIIMTSSSVRPNTFSYGGFNGLMVPFTWNGMVDSLTHILRNFMLFPFAGTPICGNFVPADAQRNDDELCLRWFQLGLLLPFARNTYGSNVTRGPLEFNLNDQKNLIDAIHERYRYNPYYYTLFHYYVETGEPVIRPMIYDFHEEPSVAFNFLTQFMIGPALMAAPVLSKAATTREAYFPPGTWYEVTGAFVYSDLNEGATLTIPGLASMTPLFLRGGHVIPTLTKPDAATAAESRLGEYTILGTFPTEEETSKGSLFVDDGVNIDSVHHFVDFEVSNTSITITSRNCRPADQTGPMSINQIKIYGFPGPKPQVKTSVPDQIRPEVLYTEEDLVLRIKTFSFNWCTYPAVTFTWIYE